MRPQEHPCATNFSVWPLNADGCEAASVSEFRAKNAGDAIQQAMDTLLVAASPDTAGWKAVRHDLRPPEDTCGCELPAQRGQAKRQDAGVQDAAEPAEPVTENRSSPAADPGIPGSEL